jgi:hypothetical protein
MIFIFFFFFCLFLNPGFRRAGFLFLFFPLHDKHNLAGSLGAEDNCVSAILLAAPDVFPAHRLFRGPHQAPACAGGDFFPANPRVIRFPSKGVGDFNGGGDDFFFHFLFFLLFYFYLPGIEPSGGGGLTDQKRGPVREGNFISVTDLTHLTSVIKSFAKLLSQKIAWPIKTANVSGREETIKCVSVRQAKLPFAFDKCWNCHFVLSGGLGLFPALLYYSP